MVTETDGDTIYERINRYNLALMHGKQGRLAAAANQLRRVIEIDQLLQHPDLEYHAALLGYIEKDLTAGGQASPD
jgi:hypothetical protein